MPAAFKKNQKVVVAVYDNRSPMGLLHLHCRVVAVVDEGVGRYYVCTKDVIIEDVIFECEMEDAELFKVSPGESFEIDWDNVDDMPKVRSVNEALEVYMKRQNLVWPGSSQLRVANSDPPDQSDGRRKQDDGSLSPDVATEPRAPIENVKTNTTSNPKPAAKTAPAATNKRLEKASSPLSAPIRPVDRAPFKSSRSVLSASSKEKVGDTEVIEDATPVVKAKLDGTYVASKGKQRVSQETSIERSHTGTERSERTPLSSTAVISALQEKASKVRDIATTQTRSELEATKQKTKPSKDGVSTSSTHKRSEVEATKASVVHKTRPSEDEGSTTHKRSEVEATKASVVQKTRPSEDEGSTTHKRSELEATKQKTKPTKDEVSTAHKRSEVEATKASVVQKTTPTKDRGSATVVGPHGRGSLSNVTTGTDRKISRIDKLSALVDTPRIKAIDKVDSGSIPAALSKGMSKKEHSGGPMKSSMRQRNDATVSGSNTRHQRRDNAPGMASTVSKEVKFAKRPVPSSPPMPSHAKPKKSRTIETVDDEGTINPYDLYDTDEPNWVEDSKKDSVLSQIIPGLKYAIRHGFPSISRLSCYDEIDGVYYRMRKDFPIISGFASGYRVTRFYNNFRIRHPDKNQPRNYEGYTRLDHPSSNDEEDRERIRARGRAYPRDDAIIEARRENDRNQEYLPYGERMLTSSPYGYYDIAKMVILECVTDPTVSNKFPQLFWETYHANNEKLFSSFRTWALEVIVPMVIFHWTKEDLALTVQSPVVIEKILFAKRTKEYASLLLSPLNQVKSRLSRVGLGRLFFMDGDEMHASLMQAATDGKLGNILDGHPRARLKLQKKSTGSTVKK